MRAVPSTPRFSDTASSPKTSSSARRKRFNRCGPEFRGAWTLENRVPGFLGTLKIRLLASSLVAALAAVVGLAQRGAPDPAAAATSYIEAHNAEAVSLLERLVNINSGTHHFDGVREVG